MDVRLPDGTIIKNVPDGTTKADLVTKLQRNGMAVPKEWMAEAPKQESGGLMQTLGNVAAGAVRGAGSIGATILEPIDAAARAVGIENSFIGRRDRRQAMDEGLKNLGADPESTAYGVGKLGAEVAGTAGVGGGIARGLGYIPGVSKAAPTLLRSLETGGISSAGGNMATRTLGGALTGGATAGLIDPDSAAEGALLGAAMPGGIKVAETLGRGLSRGASQILGSATGTSPETVRAAYQAGTRGQRSFLENMRGQAEFDDVIDAAKSGLDQMRADRAAQYRSGMVDISRDKTVLNFAPIDSAVQRVQQMGSYKGIQTNKHAAGIVDEIAEKVSEWKALNPTEYHTPEGLDALKRAIGDIRDSTQYGTPARKAADTVYNSIKSEIASQAPAYERVMKDYATASKDLDEITRALSLGDKASKDTAIRKLQSLMRNNAQSNYGNRLSLAQQLEQAGGVDLVPSIAGQAMNTWTPRGMTGALTKFGTVVAGAGTMSGAVPLSALTLAPITSPRLVGEAAYALGRTAGGVQSAAGRAASPLLLNPELRQIAEGARTALPIAILANQKDRQ